MPEEEIIEEVEQENLPTEIEIETKGKWRDFEVISLIEFEVGKTYKIKVRGQCQFMISPTKPTTGIITNEITFKKDDVNKLWIRTGEGE